MRGLDSNNQLMKSLIQGELKEILNVVKSNANYFLGIRDEYINIYYMGGSLLKISTNQKTGKCRFEFNPNYMNGYHESIPNIHDRADEWKSALPTLEFLVKEYQKGNKPHRTEKKEKIVQQALLMKNNSCKDSDYYITDMEYSCPGIGYGRFDYIALKKERGANGKFQLVLIELKYGTDSFKTTFINKNGIANYGSGIVGHALNFSRFVFGIENNNTFIREQIGKEKQMETLKFLRKETINILKNKIDLGLLDSSVSHIFGDIKEEDIYIDENNINTLFICVACQDIEKARSSIRNYLGVTGNAKYTVQKLKYEGQISDKFSLRCLISKDAVLDRLKEEQFIVLD